MYTIVQTISRYPFIILALRSHLGKTKFWCMSELHAEEEILLNYHTKEYKDLILDNIPAHGYWISQNDIMKL